MSEKLYQIISKVFNVDNSKIDDETSPENLEEWDSFNFYVLLDEIENEFNIKFDLDETLETDIQVEETREIIADEEMIKKEEERMIQKTTRCLRIKEMRMLKSTSRI